MERFGDGDAALDGRDAAVAMTKSISAVTPCRQQQRHALRTSVASLRSSGFGLDVAGHLAQRVRIAWRTTVDGPGADGAQAVTVGRRAGEPARTATSLRPAIVPPARRPARPGGATVTPSMGRFCPSTATSVCVRSTWLLALRENLGARLGDLLHLRFRPAHGDGDRRNDRRLPVVAIGRAHP